MSNIITVRKTLRTQAIQNNTPEDEAVIREWLTEAGFDYIDQTVEELTARKFWFLRDEGSTVVYVAHPADFLTTFEEVDESGNGDPFDA